MRNGCLGRALQHGKRVRIARELVRVNQPQQQLVIAVSGEAILVVEIFGDSLRVQPVQPQHFFTSLPGARDGIIAGQRRNPLPESCTGGEAGIVLVPVIIWVIVVPAPQIRARSGLSGHLAKWFQQTIFTQAHQHIVGFP